MIAQTSGTVMSLLVVAHPSRSRLNDVQSSIPFLANNEVPRGARDLFLNLNVTPGK
jgi:hypothetical protein